MRTCTQKITARFIGLAVIFGFALTLVLTPGASAKINESYSECKVGINSFEQCLPDPTLSSKIAETLHKNPSDTIEHEDVNNLRKFVMAGAPNSNSQIADLTGLGTFTNLSDLTITDSLVANISSLSNFENLKNLSLENNKISDPSPLAGLSNLEHVNLQRNEIDGTHFSAPANHDKLGYLNLGYNKLDDSALEHVVYLPSLQSLYLEGNQLSSKNINHLSLLTSLKPLYLGANSITNLDSLKNFFEFDRAFTCQL